MSKEPHWNRLVIATGLWLGWLAAFASVQRMDVAWLGAGLIASLGCLATWPSVWAPRLAAILARVASRLAPNPIVIRPAPAGPPRSALFMHISVRRPAPNAKIAPRADEVSEYVQLVWNIRYHTDANLEQGYIAVVERYADLDRLVTDSNCLFRWHTNVFAELSQDTFTVDRVAINNEVIGLTEHRTQYECRYTLDYKRRDPIVRQDVSISVTVGVTKHPRLLVIPCGFFEPTQDAAILVDARDIGATTFDIQDSLATAPGYRLLTRRWESLFGTNHTAGTSGVLVNGLVTGGSVNFMITTKARE